MNSILIAYYLIILSWLLASFFPEHRIWGMNHWAYFPTWLPISLFLLAVLAPPLLMRLLKKDMMVSLESNEKRGVSWWPISFGLITLFSACFYFFRVKTHFLGDGYWVLALLSSETPLVKSRELGESLIHVWVKTLVGGNGKTAALASFQIISIVSGFLFLIAAAIFARFHFQRASDRILFLLGMSTIGSMLLFFGYVENYSIFVLSVSLYCMIGLSIMRQKLNRWILLPFLAFSVFLHILGVTLIPSAVYLLTANSRLGRYLSEQKLSVKYSLAALIAVGFTYVFYYFYITDYFFRFAVMPLVADRFTVGGYTLFSVKHLLDYLNLLLLLLPALPLFLIVLWKIGVRQLLSHRTNRYLLIVVLSTLGAAFIFDPKLGMPRDWDLFSFAGLPLALICYYLVLDKRYLIASRHYLCLLSILLSFLSLVPRIATQNIPETAVEQVKDYAELDPLKNWVLWRLVSDYYEDVGDSAAARGITQMWGELVPERGLIMRAGFYIGVHRLQEAIELSHKALKLNPGRWAAYALIGDSYRRLYQFDSAATYYEIALGLTPYKTGIMNELGLTYMLNGQYKLAENILKKSIAMDESLLKPHRILLQLYRKSSQPVKYSKLLRKTAAREDATIGILKILGDHYLESGKLDSAMLIYDRALKKGLDSGYVDSIRNVYPDLKR